MCKTGRHRNLCAGRVSSTSTFHVGPYQSDPDPDPKPNPNPILTLGGLEVGRGGQSRVLEAFFQKTFGRPKG